MGFFGDAKVTVQIMRLLRAFGVPLHKMPKIAWIISRLNKGDNVSELEFVDVPLKVGKESKDVADLAVAIVKHFFVEKKSVKELQDLLGPAIAAAQGADKVDDELKQSLPDFVAYVGSELYGVFKEPAQ